MPRELREVSGGIQESFRGTPGYHRAEEPGYVAQELDRDPTQFRHRKLVTGDVHQIGGVLQLALPASVTKNGVPAVEGAADIFVVEGVDPHASLDLSLESKHVISVRLCARSWDTED